MSVVKKETSVTETVLVIVDILCDHCGTSCKKSSGELESARLFAHWGYDSNYDDEVWDYFFCDDCAGKIVQEYVKK